MRAKAKAKAKPASQPSTRGTTQTVMSQRNIGPTTITRKRVETIDDQTPIASLRIVTRKRPAAGAPKTEVKSKPEKVWKRNRFGQWEWMNG